MMVRSRAGANETLAEGSTVGTEPEGKVRRPHFPIARSSAGKSRASNLRLWRNVASAFVGRCGTINAVFRSELHSFVLRPAAFVIWLAATLVAAAGFSWVVA